MQNGNNGLISQWNWRHGVKFTVVVVVAIYILKSIYSVTTSHNDMNEMGHYLAAQEKDFKDFHNQADKDVESIQNGMENGAKEFSDKLDGLSKSLDDFAEDFNSSLDAAIKMIKEHEQQRIFDNFIDDHYNYYDAESYEKDRQKELSQLDYLKLPTYEEFVVLREKAFLCDLKYHNDRQEINYKNNINELKAEHNEAAIADVRKPDLWPLPLTRETREKIIDKFFPRVISSVRQDGTCIHE